MKYIITEYTKQRARESGYTVKISKIASKKIDVYRGNERIASIGAHGMSDYPTYLKTRGKTYADERRRLYFMRHKGNTLNEQLAKLLLW